MTEQLAFDLPADVKRGAEDFFVTDANAAAFAMIATPEAWPNGKLALVGPPGSGKSHLASVFATAQKAKTVAAADIVLADPLPDGPFVLEDGDALGPEAEEWVFHAHNHLAAGGHPFLLTGARPPARWPVTLPDLRSRLAATTLVTIEEPDDPLLLAVLLKQFADRQLTPAPDAVAYLHPRLPRSFAGIRDTVALLDKAALAEGRSLTRTFVARVLDSSRPDE
ncbi:MAG: hypothetical protein AAGL89_01410 [Pseudomonadota bacterium]